MPGTPRPRRPIRSFVRREGRITPAQRRALGELWPRYGIDLATLDPAGLFERAAPVVCDIGFGNGEALAAAAEAHPERNYLGVEVHRPGVGSLLRRLAAAEISNVRVVIGDANDVLARLPDTGLAAVHLYFPDPWPKKRHHKRRLVQPAFAALVARKLAPGGIVHVATDWSDYAQEILATLAATPGLANEGREAGFSARPPDRPQTKYERQALLRGHTVRDLIFRRTD